MDNLKLEWPIEVLWLDGEKWRPFADSDPRDVMPFGETECFGELLDSKVKSYRRMRHGTNPPPPGNKPNAPPNPPQPRPGK